MIQEILTYIILAAVGAIVLWKIIPHKRSRKRNQQCASCPLADSCSPDQCHQAGGHSCCH